jgi:predicted GNAT superfamily acetyltransferase
MCRVRIAKQLEVRQLSMLSEFSEAVRLQRDIWGFDDIELLPQRLFVVATKIGGQVLGAFDGSTMAAFCLCIPGIKPGGKYYLHSHMLGVLPQYRNSGVGRLLKFKQREYALASGIDLIEWTFDPLELKNAFFNIERLGAIVRRYVHNQYGTTSSHLHGGLPTDRLVPEWWIRSSRVEALAKGEGFERGRVEQRISLPANVAEIRKKDRARARSLQQEAAKSFDDCFSAGLAVIGFERTEAAGTYLLGHIG